MVCERNETIFKVEVTTGKQIGVIRNHSWNPWAVTYTADGKRLFSSGWGGTIHEWDAENLEAIPLPKGFRGTEAITLSSDGALCATVDQAGQVHVVGRPSGKEIATLSVPGGSFGVVEFSWTVHRLWLAGAGMAKCMWLNGKLRHLKSAIIGSGSGCGSRY